MGRIRRVGFVGMVAVGLLAACAAGRADQPSHRVGSAGVRVAVPKGWRFFAAGVAPRSMPYADPLVRIVTASSAVRAFPRGCKAETFRFKHHSVGLMVVEWLHPSPGAVFPARPRSFTAKNLPVRNREVECWPGRGGSIAFSSHGRDFAAYVLLSPGAPAALAAKVRGVLDTIVATGHP